MSRCRSSKPAIAPARRPGRQARTARPRAPAEPARRTRSDSNHQRINAYLVRWIRKKYMRLAALLKALRKMLDGEGDAVTVAVADRGQHEIPAAGRASWQPGGPDAVRALGPPSGISGAGMARSWGSRGLQVGEPAALSSAGPRRPSTLRRVFSLGTPVAAQERVSVQAEGGRFPGCRTPTPLCCRGDRVVARWRHHADHQGRQGGEPVAHAAGSARIGERLELGDQAADLIPRGTLTHGFQTGCGAIRSSDGGVVPVRDGKLPGVEVLLIESAAWTESVGDLGSARF
jgi:hypothetical protein